jgi:hypothetical protein
MDEMNGKEIAFKQFNQTKCLGRKGTTSLGEGD